MSVVAVRIEKEKIIIGSDSIRITGYTQEKDKLAKLTMIDENFIIGGVGDCYEHSCLLEFAKTRKPNGEDILEYMSEFHVWFKKKINNDTVKLDNAYLIVFNKKVFLFNNYFIREVTDYYAIGAGMDYALSALYLGESVEKAIETACELSIYCEKPINILKVVK